MTRPQRIDIELCLTFDEPQPLPTLAPGEILKATSTPVLYELEIDDELAALIAIPGTCSACTVEAYVDALGLCEDCRTLTVASV